MFMSTIRDDSILYLYNPTTSQRSRLLFFSNIRWPENNKGLLSYIMNMEMKACSQDMVRQVLVRLQPSKWLFKIISDFKNLPGFQKYSTIVWTVNDQREIVLIVEDFNAFQKPKLNLKKGHGGRTALEFQMKTEINLLTFPRLIKLRTPHFENIQEVRVYTWTLRGG